MGWLWQVQDRLASRGETPTPSLESTARATRRATAARRLSRSREAGLPSLATLKRDLHLSDEDDRVACNPREAEAVTYRKCRAVIRTTRRQRRR